MPIYDYKIKVKMSDRPKSNHAQIVTAIVAILALLFGQNMCSKDRVSNDSASLQVRQDVESYNSAREIDSTSLISNRYFKKLNEDRLVDQESSNDDFELETYDKLQDLLNLEEYDAAMFIIDTTIMNLDGHKLFKQQLLRTKSEIEIQKRYGADIVSWNEDCQIYILVKNSKFGLVNQSNDLVFRPVYDDILPVNSGLFAVLKQENYGFIDDKGKVILNFIFDSVFDVHLPFVVVMKKSKIGLVNSSGELIIEAKNDDLEIEGEFIILNKDNKYAIFDTTGSAILDFKYSLITLEDDGNILVYDKNDEYLFNKRLKKIIKQ